MNHLLPEGLNGVVHGRGAIVPLEPVPAEEAVSYTHLDVYKRQEGTELEGLRGEVLPGGADRQLWREIPGETSIEIDARYDVRLEPGATVSLHATGLRRASKAGTYFMVQLRFDCLLYTSRCV